MSKIKKLSDQEAKKIAAGEVVDRPANVIKELIENSIDAHATNITIYLEQAGKKLIQVVDNGHGMSEEDARICFDQHTTSKISCLEDLELLSTLGFRGEALYSISAISKIEIITNQNDFLQGTRIIYQDGKITKLESVSCSIGTDISIRDIFYNLPARLKFLKKDEAELRQIMILFQSLCLSYKEIHFKLYNDGKLIYNCPKVGELGSRIAQLWDHSYTQNMIQLHYVNESINLNVRGLISNHQFSKFNRNQIFFFLNKRWIKNNVLYKALLKGYMNVLPKNKFPVAILFIDLPQSLIDVNIHPRKEEVEILNSKKIETIIQENVRKFLENNLFNDQKNNNQVTKEENKVFLAATQTTFDFENLPFFEPIESVIEPYIINQPLKQSQLILQNNDKEQDFVDNVSLNENCITLDESSHTYNIIGQYKGCYILIERNSGLLIIDQHAAHERILYELFSKKFNDVAKVNLIFPLIVSTSQENIDLLFPYFEILHKYGIEIEHFSKDHLVIKSTPVYLKDVAIEDIIYQLISWIKENQYLETSEFFKLINDKLCAQMACKAAIKSGDMLNKEQMMELLETLQKTNNSFTCPHGRPTSWSLEHNDIERKFKRKL